MVLSFALIALLAILAFALEPLVLALWFALGRLTYNLHRCTRTLLQICCIPKKSRRVFTSRKFGFSLIFPLNTFLNLLESWEFQEKMPTNQ